jgi:signal transduction histidine kinase
MLRATRRSRRLDVPSRSDEEPSRETNRILFHLAEIGAGRSSVTEEEIVAQENPQMSQILLGLLVLAEDLDYARRKRDEAEAARAVEARERERLLVEVREAVSSRDRFLAVASHELRTPVSTLLLLVDNLGVVAGSSEAGVVPAELLARHLTTLRRQVDRLTSLVAQMLDVSRITGAGLELNPTPTDLTAIVREAVDRFELECHRRGVTVRLEAGGPIEGMWDGPRLDQVVTNLVSNALKYGAGQPVDVSVRAEPGRAVVQVHDRGPGIPEEEREKIFAPFARAVATRHHAGIGLGLWITRQIVQASGGTVRVDGRTGEGSTFTVELPR